MLETGTGNNLINGFNTVHSMFWISIILQHEILLSIYNLISVSLQVQFGNNSKSNGR